jgi:hypothetical protein
MRRKRRQNEKQTRRKTKRVKSYGYIVDIVVVKEDKKVLMTERGRDGKTASEVTGRPLAAMDRA